LRRSNPVFLAAWIASLQQAALRATCWLAMTVLSPAPSFRGDAAQLFEPHSARVVGIGARFRSGASHWCLSRRRFAQSLLINFDERNTLGSLNLKYVFWRRSMGEMANTVLPSLA
jgi:hypothetical protein